MGYLLLAFVAAAGFVASVACHITGWLVADLPKVESVFLLHVGCIFLGFPFVIFANRTMPKGGHGNLAHLFAVLPKWVSIAAACLFAYAIVNFVYFLYCTAQFPRNKVPAAIELRGFSGHWMLFFGIEAVGFFALARLARAKREEEQCPK